jgi:hypothetical protein
MLGAHPRGSAALAAAREIAARRGAFARAARSANTRCVRLTAKFLLLLLLATAAVLGVSGWRRTQREVELFDADMRRDAGVVAVALAGAVEHAWLNSGEAAAVALVADFSRGRHVRGRLLWLDGRSALPAHLPLAHLDSGQRRQARSVRDLGRGFLYTTSVSTARAAGAPSSS